jgi:hypothetical protein
MSATDVVAVSVSPWTPHRPATEETALKNPTRAPAAGLLPVLAARMWRERQLLRSIYPNPVATMNVAVPEVVEARLPPLARRRPRLGEPQCGRVPNRVYVAGEGAATGRSTEPLPQSRRPPARLGVEEPLLSC